MPIRDVPEPWAGVLRLAAWALLAGGLAIDALGYVVPLALGAAAVIASFVFTERIVTGLPRLGEAALRFVPMLVVLAAFAATGGLADDAGTAFLVAVTAPLALGDTVVWAHERLRGNAAEAPA